MACHRRGGNIGRRGRSGAMNTTPDAPLRGSANPHISRNELQDYAQDPRLQGWKTLAEDELNALIELLRCMLAWIPSERLDIS